MNTHTDEEKAVIDTFGLLGVSTIDGGAVTTYCSHTTTIGTALTQALYTKLGDYTTWRSIDAVDGHEYLSFRVDDRFRVARLQQWERDTVPPDCTLTRELLALLTYANGSIRTVDDGWCIDLQTTPLDADGAERVRTACEMIGVDAKHGVGVDPLVINSDDALDVWNALPDHVPSDHPSFEM